MADKEVDPGLRPGQEYPDPLEIDRQFYLWFASGPVGQELDGILMESTHLSRKEEHLHAILTLVQDGLMKVSRAGRPVLSLTDDGQAKLRELGLEPKSSASPSYKSNL